RASARDRVAAAATARAREARGRGGDRAAEPLRGGGIEGSAATVVPHPRARGLSVERKPLGVERLQPPVVEEGGRLRRAHWNLPGGRADRRNRRDVHCGPASPSFPVGA